MDSEAKLDSPFHVMQDLDNSRNTWNILRYKNFLGHLGKKLPPNCTEYAPPI